MKTSVGFYCMAVITLVAPLWGIINDDFPSLILLYLAAGIGLVLSSMFWKKFDRQNGGPGGMKLTSAISVIFGLVLVSLGAILSATPKIWSAYSDYSHGGDRYSEHYGGIAFGMVFVVILAGGWVWFGHQLGRHQPGTLDV